MKELRCKNCNKLLVRYREFVAIELKCSRCQVKNTTFYRKETEKKYHPPINLF